MFLLVFFSFCLVSVLFVSCPVHTFLGGGLYCAVACEFYDCVLLGLVIVKERKHLIPFRTQR